MFVCLFIYLLIQRRPFLHQWVDVVQPRFRSSWSWNDDDLVFPEPAERSSFLLESVKQTCQYKTQRQYLSGWLPVSYGPYDIPNMIHDNCKNCANLQQAGRFASGHKVEKVNSEGPQLCHLKFWNVKIKVKHVNLPASLHLVLYSSTLY